MRPAARPKAPLRHQLEPIPDVCSLSCKSGCGEADASIFAGAIRIPFSTVPRPWKDRSTSMRNWSQGVTAVFAVETMAFKSERHVARGQNFTMAGLRLASERLSSVTTNLSPGEISAEYTSLARGRVDEKSPSHLRSGPWYCFGLTGDRAVTPAQPLEFPICPNHS